LEDHDLRLWDSESGEELRHVWHETTYAFPFALFPDGQFALLSGVKGIRLLNVETGQEEYSFGKSSLGLGVSPDGRRAFFAGVHTKTEASGRIISVDGKSTEAAEQVAKMGEDGFKNIKVIFTGCTVHVWDLKSRDEVRQFQGPDAGMWRFTFSPDGRVCAAAFQDVQTKGTVNAPAGPRLRLYDLENGGRLLDFKEPPAKMGATPVFSQDGRLLASGYEDGSVCVWKTDGGELMRTYQGHVSKVNAAVFSPDGQRILTGGEDKTVRLWDVATGKELAHFDHPDSVRSVAIAPDGKRALSGCHDRALYLWKLP
jgi:WD40 repeat protein